VENNCTRSTGSRIAGTRAVCKFNCIEPQYEYQGLVSTIHPPDYRRNLGSSKSRTKQQEEAGEKCILDLLNNQPSSSAVAFTDGSRSGNPGPCGSGAIIFHKEAYCGSIQLTSIFYVVSISSACWYTKNLLSE
jgi:hypothetical protein